MDQKTLYDGAQAAPPRPDDPYEMQGRDDFIVDCLRRQAVPAAKLGVAELSVGDGRLSRALSVLPGVGELTCADISGRRLETARALIGAAPVRVNYVECNFDVDFDRVPAGAFDIVLALDILEHVFDVFGFVQHCRRILRPGGLLVLRVPNIAYLRHRLRLLFGALPITASWFGPAGDFTAWRTTWGWDGGHIHWFTIPAVRQLLSEHDLQVEECRDAGARYEGVRNLFPNLLYSNPIFCARKRARA